jgi:hypothetical protein
MRRIPTLLLALIIYVPLLLFGQQFALRWEFHYDECHTPTNIVFEVWSNTNLADEKLTAWKLKSVTSATNFPFNATNAEEFFKVRARDLDTGDFSDWAR